MSKVELKLRKMIENDNPGHITLENIGKKYINKKHLEELRSKSKIHEGGVVPLIPILLGILGAAGSAAGIAGGIATTVSKAKEAQKMAIEKKIAEEQLAGLVKANKKEEKNELAKSENLGDGVYLNPFKEDNAKGEGIFLNKFEGSGFYKFIKSKDKKFGKEYVKNFKNKEIHIEKQGEGLFLYPSN